jgi:hypothetical protein
MVQHIHKISFIKLTKKAIAHFCAKILTQFHLLKYVVGIKSITKINAEGSFVK